MKKFTLILFALAFLVGGTATAQLTYQWNACKSGNDTDDFTRNIVNDAAGNTYATVDYYISSPAHTQSWVWIKSATSGFNMFEPYNGAPGNQNTKATNVIQYGNSIYVVGAFTDSSTFDLNGYNSGMQTSHGGTDIFLAKYDMVGHLAWAKVFGGTGNDDVTGFAVVNNHVYMAGHFADTLHFDVSNELVSNGGNDLYVTRLDTAGNITWARDIGGTADDMDMVMDVNAAEEIFLAARFSSGSLSFGTTGAPVVVTTTGANNYMLLARYNASGAYSWGNYVGTGGAGVYAKDIIAHSGGDMFIGGYYTSSGAVDFDPSGGTANLTSSGGQDIFLARYTTSGAAVWANSIGSTGDDACLGMAKDTLNRVFITGYFNGTVDFDPAAGTDLTTSNGGKDFYIARYAADGTYNFADGFGAASDDIGTCLAFYPLTSSLYVGGGVGSDDVDFNPTSTTSNPNQYTSQHDAFIVKYLVGLPTGINEDEVETLTLYPNPAANFVNIALPQNAGKTTLKVYNMQGQLMLQKQVTTTYVDVAELSNGLYTLTLENDKGIIGRNRLMIAR